MTFKLIYYDIRITTYHKHSYIEIGAHYGNQGDL
jgi:hypothetical protein